MEIFNEQELNFFQCAVIVGLQGAEMWGHEGSTCDAVEEKIENGDAFETYSPEEAACLLECFEVGYNVGSADAAKVAESVNTKVKAMSADWTPPANLSFQ